MCHFLSLIFFADIYFTSQNTECAKDRLSTDVWIVRLVVSFPADWALTRGSYWAHRKKGEVHFIHYIVMLLKLPYKGSQTRNLNADLWPVDRYYYHVGLHPVIILYGLEISIVSITIFIIMTFNNRQGCSEHTIVEFNILRDRKR